MNFEETPNVENLNFKEAFEALGVKYESASPLPETDRPVLIEGFEKLRRGVAILERTKDVFLEFIHGPTISDTFANDHSARREWRNGLSPELLREYMRNRLRANNISTVYGRLELLKMMLDSENIHTPKATRVQELYNQLPPREAYQNATDEEKNQIVEKLDSVCREFLRLVRE